MKPSRRILFCLSATALLFCFSLDGLCAPVRIGYSALSGVFAPLWVAQDEGYFKRHALDTDTVYISGGSVAIQALLAGNLQFAVAGAAAGVRAAANGADLKIIANTMNAMDFQLVSRSEIASLQALRGKRIGVTRLGGDTDFALELVLQKAGLLRGRDVAVLQTGGMPQLIGALRAGAVDAGVITAMQGLTAAKSGLRQLVDFSEIDFPYPFGAVIARSAYVRAYRDIALRLLRAYVEAVHRVVEDRETTMKTLAKYTRVREEETLDAAWRHYRTRYQKKLYIDPEAGKNLMRVEFQGGAAAAPDRFIDNSFVAELERQRVFQTPLGR
ncbi:MAG TPA: ABC transporter substrate-binding protein [Candidatus Binatia bacterium]|jgi:NitT/TauT family transport system substrate-binding protein